MTRTDALPPQPADGGAIADSDTLQACVGRLPGPRDLKVIDHLDEHAQRWIAASPLLFAAFGDDSGIALTMGGGAAGFVRVDGPRHLSLPAALLDEPQIAHEGQGFGSLFLVPGLGETLRINGRVLATSEAGIGIAVDECYLHCAKALIRSDFWAAAADQTMAPEDSAALAHASRFLALATIDRDGHADLSPKGDPAGALLQWHDGALWFPDRPGNRRVDSFRNILSQPRIAALALTPGSARVLRIAGNARIGTHERVRQAFAVADKTPHLVTRIGEVRMEPRDSAALERAALWPCAAPPAGIEPASIFRDHVRLSQARGAQAALARVVVSVPGLMRKGLDKDYEKNLY